MASNRGRHERDAIPEVQPVLPPRIGNNPQSMVLDGQAQSQGHLPTVRASEFYGPHYSMSHQHLGKAVVINNNKFRPTTGPALQDRTGSDVDTAKMYQRFEELGFDVGLHTDITKDQILRVFDEIAATDHSDYDYFFCALMSHGDEDGLWATDRKLKIKDITEKLSPSNCPSLLGKPKVFFVQSCRGTELDRGCPVRVQHDRTVSDTAGDTQEYNEYLREQDQQEVFAEDVIVIPSDMDFLIVNATVDGKYSFRHTSGGTPFITALSNEFENLYRNHLEMDIYTLLHKVNTEVALKFQSQALGAGGGKQMPCFVSMLTKSLIVKEKP